MKLRKSKPGPEILVFLVLFKPFKRFFLGLGIIYYKKKLNPLKTLKNNY